MATLEDVYAFVPREDAVAQSRCKKGLGGKPCGQCVENARYLRFFRHVLPKHGFDIWAYDPASPQGPIKCRGKRFVAQIPLELAPSEEEALVNGRLIEKAPRMFIHLGMIADDLTLLLDHGSGEELSPCARENLTTLLKQARNTLLPHYTSGRPNGSYHVNQGRSADEEEVDENESKEEEPPLKGA